MRQILIIGIGAGDPDQVTVQAVRALNRADVFFVLTKGEEKQELIDVREEILRRHVTRPAYRVVTARDPERDRSAAGYEAAVADWRRRRADVCEGLIRDELPDDGCGVFLVWGDPALYDSTLAIVEDLRARGTIAFEYAVIPGVSSVSALAAGHRTGLNRVGRPFQVTTGRRLAQGWPAGVADVVVMLDANCAFADLPDVDDVDIFWGAYLGTPDEILISGPVREVADEIRTARREARRRKGWIMDTYLLRRARPR